MRTAYDYYRRCVELCREHGYLEIEAGNFYMLAWCRLYLNEAREAMAEVGAAINTWGRIASSRF